MGKEIRLFKKQKPAPLDADVSDALREMAGWPQQQHLETRSRHRHRQMTIQRDETGRIISSLEHIEEDEFEQSSDSWGK